MEPLPTPFAKLLSSSFESCPEFCFIDIGAYRGDFTRSLLSLFPNGKAVLFEPTPDNFAHLSSTFQDTSNIEILNNALGKTSGTQDFYICEQSATNSLLQPTQEDGTVIQVEVFTLDQFLIQKVQLEVFGSTISDSPCHFIKIDTQGNDLNILEGGLNFLQIKQPWILSEVIFINLYNHQASYYKILDFFHQHQYSLSGIFNLHYTPEGLMAYADFLFIPKLALEQNALLTAIPETFQCLDGDYWMQQAQIYEQACIERLNLINELNQVAGDRLQLIERLDAEIQRLKSNL